MSVINVDLSSINKEIKPKKKVRRTSYFKNHQFASKLFLKLTNLTLDKSIQCISIFKFDTQNRNKQEIMTCVPYLTTLNNFYQYMSLKEYEKGIIDLLTECAWIIFYRYFPTNSIIKKSGEGGELFQLIFDGKVAVLNIVFEKECLTEEDYIKYLIKLILINEENALKLVTEFNKDIIDIPNNDIENYCFRHYPLNFENIYKKAIQELSEIGFKFSYDLKTFSVNNLENYMKSLVIKNNVKQINEQSKEKKYYTICHYEYFQTLNSGSYFGNLITKYTINDNLLYFSLSNCDTGFISNKESNKSKVFVLVYEKMIKLFQSYLQFYFIFKNINTNYFYKYYSGLFQYKILNEKDKLYIQNSIHEGVYFLIDGEITVYTERKMNEIGGISIALQYSLENFREQISTLSHEEMGSSNEASKLIKNPIYRSKEYIDYSQGKKTIILNTIKNREAIGLNEFYDQKTKLLFFTAEVKSKQATLFYIPNKAFLKILTREKSVETAVVQMVELKAKYYIGTLNNFKISILKEVGYKIGLSQKQIQNIENLTDENLIENNNKKDFDMNKSNSFFNKKYNLMKKNKENKFNLNKIEPFNLTNVNINNNNNNKPYNLRSMTFSSKMERFKLNSNDSVNYNNYSLSKHLYNNSIIKKNISFNNNISKTRTLNYSNSFFNNMNKSNENNNIKKFKSSSNISYFPYIVKSSGQNKFKDESKLPDIYSNYQKKKSNNY
jgi:hypothetical protein